MAAERFKEWTVFARSEAGIVGSNTTQGMDVWYVCAFFCVCVVLCLGRGLATSLSPVQGVLPSVNDHETEKSVLCSKIGSKLPNGSKGKEKNLRTIQHDIRSLKVMADWSAQLLCVQEVMRLDFSHDTGSHDRKFSCFFLVLIVKCRDSYLSILSTDYNYFLPHYYIKFKWNHPKAGRINSTVKHR
jgi:hypothetical protein